MATSTSRTLVRLSVAAGLGMAAILTVVLLPVMVPFLAVIASIALPSAGIFYLWAWRTRPAA